MMHNCVLLQVTYNEVFMSKSDTWESDLLKLVFNNTTASLIGDATGLVGSGTVGVLYVSLHTADPGETGDQTTNEATYTSYARVSVARTTGGWTISGTNPTQSANAATVTFPQCTGGSNTITYVGVGTSVSGTGKLLYSGALGSSLAVSNNITPSFSIGALVITED
jgi:hypothetical protein